MTATTSGYFLADANSLAYAYKAGGSSLIISYIATANKEGLIFAITDQIQYELITNSVNGLINQLISNRSIQVITTQTYGAVQEGQLQSDNAGEISMLEVAQTEMAAGKRAIIWSDDGFFTKSQNITNSQWFNNGQTVRGFKLPPDYGATEVFRSSQMLASAAAQMNTAAYNAAITGYMSQSSIANSPRLRDFTTTETITSTTGELNALRSAGPKSEAIVLADGASLINLKSFTGGTLKVLGVAGIVYDTLSTSAQAAQQVQEGDNSAAAQTLTNLAARLYFGLEGAEGGAAIGASLFSGTGPGAIVAGIVGGLIGGIVGTVGGQAAVNEISQATSQILAYITGQSGPDVSLTVHPDPILQQQIHAEYQQLLAAGIPSDQANEFVNLVQDEWVKQWRINPNVTISEVAYQMINDVRINQQITPTENGGPTITTEPSTNSQNNTTGQNVQIFDNQGNPTATVVINADGSISAVTYDASGNASQGASTTPNASPSEAITNQSNGSQNYISFSSNAAGGSITDIQQFNSDTSQQYEQITTTPASGQISVAISGQGDLDSINNAAISVAVRASATITGNLNTLTLGSNSSATVDGQSNIVNASIANLTLGVGSSAQVFGAYNTIVTGNGTNITVGGANDQITGDNSTITLTSTKSAATIFGQGDTISAASGDILTISGDAGQTGIANTLSISGGAITLASNADLILTGTGTGNTITLGAYDTFMSSTTGDKITATNTGDQITETGANANISIVAGDSLIIDSANAVVSAAYASVTVLGLNATINGIGVAIIGDAGATITATGPGDVIYANNATITLTSTNAAYTITGYGDTINGANGDILTIIGSGQNAAADIVELNNGTLDIAGNSNVAITDGINSEHDTINLGSNDTFASNAYWDTTVATGIGDVIAETGSYANVSEVAGDTATIASNQSIVSAPNAIVNVTNGATTINGDGASISQVGGSQVTVNGANDTITATGRYNTDILNGVGDNIATDTNGSYDKITANGANEILALNGYGDTLTANGVNDFATLGLHTGNTTLNGADEILNSNGGGTVNSTGANDTIFMNGANSTANISGFGSNLTEAGTNDVARLTGASEFVTDAASATYSTITSSGASDTIIMNGAYDQSTDTGAHDNISSSGASTTIYAEGAFQNINISGASDIIQSTAANANANITSSGANESIYSNGNNSVATFTGSSAYIYMMGNNDTTTISGASAWLADYGSSNIDTLTGSNETGLARGTNDQINSSGASDKITLYMANDSSTDSGANTTVNAQTAGDTITVSGTSDSITSRGATASTPDLITFNGTSESLNGNYNTITFGSGATASITGSYDTITATGGNAITISGTYDTFSGNITNSITFSGSTTGDIVSGGALTFDDPIVFNLDGGPVQTVGLNQSPATFDIGNTGQAVQTGWVTPGEGVLVYIGGTTTSGGPDIIGGYDQLDQLAGATSGNLDATNSIWKDLALWVDPTGTAQFASDQLHSLNDLGIASISLSPTKANIDSNGNEIAELGSFLLANGTSGQAAAVDFVFNPTQQVQPAAAIGITAHA